MRPLSLEIEGFTAFRQPTCIDFEALDLFAITGPTGAGKSSLIDAICYALYGRVPRVAAEVGACISQGLPRMQVVLVFEARGVRYRVLRETRRKGAGNTRLERLVGDVAGNDWQPISDRAREVTQRIEEIIGLDYEAFIRSALLPQGQFQEFLAGAPDRRRDVLRRLLRLDVYERMRTRAGQTAQSLQTLVAATEHRLQTELADATPETLARRRDELARADAESKHLETSIAGLRTASESARRLAGVRDDYDRQRIALRRAGEHLEAAQALVAGGDAELATLREALSTVREHLDANAFDADLFAALTAAANQALAVDRATKALRDAEGAVVSLETNTAVAQTAAATTARTHEAAQEALEATQVAFDEAKRHDFAAALQAGLHPGDACPVCGGPVGVLTAPAPAALATAELAYTTARRREEVERKAATDAATRAAVAANSLEHARTQAGQQQETLAQATTLLVAALPGAVDRSFAVVQTALAAQKAARDERAGLEAEVARVAAALAAEEQRLSSARGDLLRFEMECHGAESAVAAAEAAVTTAEAQLATAIVGLDAGSDFDGTPGVLPRLEAALAAATTRQHAVLTDSGRIAELVRHLEADIETAKQLRADLIGRKAEYNTAADLAQMLRADRFQAYVQAEAMRTLAEDGSRRLLQLSAGRYELEVAEGGQDFVVRDKWNADEQRSVRTLSGGETFLASLALALALAESLPGLAPGRRLSLDSIFLDEGFGALDPEALDRAADALDALRMEDRLVCVVTHLRELAERLPAHVVVSKSESGSTISIE